RPLAARGLDLAGIASRSGEGAGSRGFSGATPTGGPLRRAPPPARARRARGHRGLRARTARASLLMKEVQIFTDGSSRGNPGPGGYGTVVRYGPHQRELAQGFLKTTNNRMEILAAVAGLEILKEPCRVA